MSTIIKPKKLRGPGKYRWAIQRKNGHVLNKYNADGTKNPYHFEGQTLDRKNISTFGFTDKDGNITASVEVPDGAVVFQRRRVAPINYYGRRHEMEETVPAQVIRGRYVPERKVKHVYNEINYDEVWMFGWRKKEADGSVTVKLKCLYPDGKVDEYDSFGVKYWLKEPEWFSEEQV